MNKAKLVNLKFTGDSEIIVKMPQLDIKCRPGSYIAIPPGRYDFQYIKHNIVVSSAITISHNTVMLLTIPDQFFIIDDQYYDDLTPVVQDNSRSFDNIMNWSDLKSRLSPQLQDISSMMNVWPGARNIEEAKQILEQSCPNVISFDHDLGIVNNVEQTSMEIVYFIINRDLDQNGQYIPEDFTFAVHSKNPVGKQNIISTLNRYLEFRKNP